MSLTRAEALQRAVFTQISAALSNAGDGGLAIPVFDAPREDAPKLFARIDDGGVSESLDLSEPGRSGLHMFTIQLFERDAGGLSKVKALRGLIAGALQDWAPLARAHPMQFLSAGASMSPDGAAQAWARYSTMIWE